MMLVFGYGRRVGSGETVEVVCRKLADVEGDGTDDGGGEDERVSLGEVVHDAPGVEVLALREKLRARETRLQVPVRVADDL